MEHVDGKFMQIWDLAFMHCNNSAFDQNNSPTDNTKWPWLPTELTIWFDGVHRHWLWLWYHRWLFDISMWLPLALRPPMGLVGMHARIHGASSFSFEAICWLCVIFSFGSSCTSSSVRPLADASTYITVFARS